MKTLFFLFLTLGVGLTGLFAQPSSAKSKKIHVQDLYLTARTSGSFTYTLTTMTEPYSDLVNPISINNNEIWDDPEYVVPLGFPFQLNGHDITSLEFYGLGSLAIAPTENGDTLTSVFPFEADLIDRGVVSDTSMSPISYLIEGVPGTRIQKIEFKNAGSFEEYFAFGTTDIFIHFQLWLYEGSNMIEFRFGEHAIDDPDLFYSGEPGAFAGVSDLDLLNFLLINPNFLTGPAATPVLSVLDSTLVGTPANGTVYQLTWISPLSVNVTGTNATSVCNPNGSATATASGGVPVYSFLWSNGDTTSTITGLAAGTYSVTVSDTQGDTVSGSVTITMPDPLLTNATSTDETTPDANDGTASVAPTGGQPPYDILWSTGSTDPVITGLAPGMYSVTVMDDEGCTSAESVIVNPAECLELEVVAILTFPSCNGACDGMIEITDVVGGSAPYSYTWSNGGTTPLIMVCAGDYFVTITDANNCMVITDFTIGEPTPVVANAASTNETGFGQNDGTAWALPSGGTPPYSYTWSNASTDSLITNLSPGNYLVTITDDHGCADSLQVVVLPYICSAMVMAGIADASCADTCDGGIFIISPLGPEYTYTWSTGETTAILSPVCAGTYILAVTNVVDHCMYVDSFQVSEPEPLIASVDTIIHLTDSTVTAISISAAGGSPPYTYFWTGQNGFESNAEDLTGIEPGTYRVQVTDANNCTTSIGLIEVLDQTVSATDPDDAGIRIYPNPARDLIHMEIPDDIPFDIQLISLQGRKMKSWTKETRLDVDDVLPGMYMLLITADDKRFIHRFIKL